jgi:uncharacterized protein (DUF58 family)
MEHTALPVNAGTPLIEAAGPLFDSLRGTRWGARQLAALGPTGTHRSRRRGTALEFTEYRPYRQGDDPRRLDWRLLARTDRAYVRITDDHALVPTAFVVDASASMAYPRPSLAKWRTAQLATLGLAFVAHSAGDPVALTVVGTHTTRYPLRARRGVLSDLIAMLQRVTPAGSGALTPAIEALAQRARARLIVVSDFLGDESDTLASVRALAAAGVACTAVHVVAHEELAPAPHKSMIVSDPEESTVRRPLTDATRSLYLAKFTEWRASLRQAWQGAGASYAMATTDESVDRIVRRMVRAPDVRT